MSFVFNIKEFQTQIDRLLNALPKEMLKINKKVALDAIPKITNRLIDEGKTSEGKSLGKYSTRPMSPLRLINQSSGKGAQQRLYNEVKKQKKAGLPAGISYEKFRQLNNLPTDHVTLSFTGDTLGDLGVLEQNINGTTVNVVVGSRGSKQKDIYNKKGKITGSKDTAEVLEELDEKYGRALDTELLDMSKEEREDVTLNQDEMFQEFLDKYFA